MNNTTMQTVRQKFSDLKRDVKRLEKLDGDAYYGELEHCTDEIRRFASEENLKELRVNEILLLCDWVQRFRPMALHTFLIYCGRHA